jgi:tRNA(fMet)-specific endonuclease VapC
VRYLLDTVTVIGFINGGPEGPVTRAIRRVGVDAVAISSIVRHELMFGAFNSHERRRAINVTRVEAIVFPVLDLDTADADAAARLRVHFRWAGRPIGPYDLLIAGQALARGLTVVTANTSEFGRVPGLLTEDWTA